ncbi:MAG: hypothetical protein QOD93_6788, partial [Acetobacteraceae bacterium]|nr:hypothetical protein [Acetobacteraceae bacterium]
MIAANALTAYRAAAVRLRETAEWNRFDASFQDMKAVHGKQRRGRLIPLVDANIVKFFMDPDHGVRLIDSFASLYAPQHEETTDEPASPQHLFTFARVTAEFMFLSSAISIGNEERRLWRESPLIAPAHAEETASMLRQIERKISELYERVSRMTEAQVLGVDGRRAAESVEALRASDADPKTYQSLVRDVSRSFEELFVPKSRNKQAADETTALEEGSRWLRLMRETKLRPLLSHSMCDPDVLHPPADKVRALAETLVAQKKRAAWTRGESSTRVSQLAWQDATVVVQTAMLNDLARRQSETEEEVRFILISGDETLHAVYADQFWRDPDASPADYVLRRPLQYIPIMNARDIPNGYQAKELFDTFRAVLDTVTDFVTQRTNKAFALEYDWRNGSYKAPRWHTELEMPALRRLAELWLQATIATNALCAGLAVHDFGIKDLVSRLDKFAGDKEALAPLIDLHEQIFRDIDGTQLPLIAQELLTDVVGARRRQSKATGVAGPRILLLIREQFDDVTNKLPMDEFVTRLAQSRGGANMAQLQKAMSRWTRAKVLFFAGTVAAIANNFERAARHLSHAEHLFRTDPPAAPVREGRHDDLAEVSYLRCVVDRMRMRDSSVFNEARHRLARLAELAQKDSFEYARLMSESGSLFLMRYFNLRFGIEDSTEAGVPDAMIKRSKSFFDEARRASMSVRERRLVD